MDPAMIALIVKAAIPIISPIVVAVVKHFFPGVPGVTLPVLATGVGAATDAVSGVATGTEISPVEGSVLGLAGVGVREVFDQVKQTPLVASRKSPTLMVLLGVLLAAAWLAA